MVASSWHLVPGVALRLPPHGAVPGDLPRTRHSRHTRFPLMPSQEVAVLLPGTWVSEHVQNKEFLSPVTAHVFSCALQTRGKD